MNFVNSIIAILALSSFTLAVPINDRDIEDLSTSHCRNKLGICRSKY